MDFEVIGLEKADYIWMNPGQKLLQFAMTRLEDVKAGDDEMARL